MNQIDVLIPARAGSTGVKGKNVRTLHGNPLIAYTIYTAKMCHSVRNIYVSTDSVEIAKIAEEYGAVVPFLRPAEFAQNLSTDLEVLKHFFSEKPVAEVAYLRPTTPFREFSVVETAIEDYFSSKGELTGLRSVQELTESPYKMFQMTKNGYGKPFFSSYQKKTDFSNLPRQLFPKAYLPNGYIDVVKKETVLSGTDFGSNIKLFLTEEVLEIDTEAQFDRAQDILKTHLPDLPGLVFLEREDDLF